MKHIYALVFLFNVCSLLGQASILAERIDIRITDKSLEEALETLSESRDFFFSYNPSILQLERRVSLDLRNVPLREVLDQVINDPSISYKEIGNHVILSRTRPLVLRTKEEARRRPPSKPPANFVLSGFIVDSLTGRKLAHASVYELSQSTAAISDEQGYYELRLKSSSQPYHISVSHRFYEAQSHTIQLQKNKIFSPLMVPRSIKKVVPTAALLASAAEINPIQDVFLVRQFVKPEILAEPVLQEQLDMSFAQLSFIPKASTNGSKAYQKTNRFSLNVLGGYSAGVRGVEVGGLMNIDRGEVHGLQVAGLGNVVGGNTAGMQVSGIFNVNRRSVKGAQLAGINNWADSLVGVQLSPINNVLVGKLMGIQGTAIANVSVGEVRGFQFAGIANWGKDLKGGQFAGILNISTEDFSGIQAAGILNYAQKGKGLQIGLINVSDSLEGVALGLLNIINHGYNAIEIGASPTLTTQAKLKMGNHWLYNIFAIGARPGKHNIWGYGYGLGNALKVTKKSYIHSEAIVWQMNQDKRILNNLNLLTQVNISYHQPISPHFEFSIGPVLNFHYSRYLDDETGKPLSALNPYAAASSLTNQASHSDFWLGGQVAISLLK